MLALWRVTMTWMMTCNKLSWLKEDSEALYLRMSAMPPEIEIHHCSTETFLAGPAPSGLYPIRTELGLWWWNFYVDTSPAPWSLPHWQAQDSAMMSQVSKVFIQGLFDSGLDIVPLPQVRKGAAPSGSPGPAERMLS